MQKANLLFSEEKKLMEKKERNNRFFGPAESILVLMVSVAFSQNLSHILYVYCGGAPPPPGALD